MRKKKMQDGGRGKIPKTVAPNSIRNPSFLAPNLGYEKPQPVPERRRYTEEMSTADAEAQMRYESSTPKMYLDTEEKLPRLTKGKLTGATPNKRMIEDLIASADKYGIPRSQMLAIAANESMFGKGYRNDGLTEMGVESGASQKDVVSAWNMDLPYKRETMQKFLYDKGVPNIQLLRNKVGYQYIEDLKNIPAYRKSVDSALNVHPEWIDEYKNINKRVIPQGDINYFDLTAEAAKKYGVGSSRFNPGDPDYSNKIKKMQALIESDPVLRPYIKKEYGGEIKQFASDDNQQDNDMARNGKSLSPSKAKEMLRDGTANGKKLTDRQKRYFGFIAGGGTPKAKQGARITQLSDNPVSNGIFRFDGPSHENGGIPITYANQGVEVEGDETGYIDLDGDLNVFGNMTMPGTSVKFKNFAKEIAKGEQKATRRLNKSSKLVNENDPYDPFERLSFNAGMLMGKGAENDLKRLSLVKEATSELQNYMLDNEMDQYYGERAKARHGAIIKAANGFSGSGDEPDWLSAARNPDSNSYIPSLVDPVGETRNALELDQDGPGGPSLAQRHKNPGNIMYNPKADYQKRLGAQKGDPRYNDKGELIGYFAKFPSMQAGIGAMRYQLFGAKSYKDLTVDEAARKWVYGNPKARTPGYANIPKDLAGKKIRDLSEDEQKRVFDTFTQGEDSKMYNWTPGTEPSPVSGNPKNPSTNVKVGSPTIPLVDLARPDRPVPDKKKPPVEYTGPNKPPKTLPPLEIPPERQRDPFRNPLRFSQIAPELVTLATERPEFVPGQRYEPQLYQPYAVSFQDQLNENEATFRALSQQIPGNPAALSSLAGQKYQADSQVLANQFRTNQGIENDIINRNVSTMNDAQLKNIGLLDTQLVRQSQARSNTRENINNALSSLAEKFDQNRLETLNYNVASNLFPHYTFDKYGRSEYQVADTPTFMGAYNPNSSDDDYYKRTRTEYDSTGNVRKQIVNEPSDAEKAKIDYQARMNAIKQQYEPSTFYKRVMQGFTRPGR